MSKRITDCEIKSWVVAIYALMTEGDCDGLWIGNIDDAIAYRMEKMGLIEIDTVLDFNDHGDVIGSEPHYILSDWGVEIAKAFKAEDNQPTTNNGENDKRKFLIFSNGITVDFLGTDSEMDSMIGEFTEPASGDYPNGLTLTRIVDCLPTSSLVCLDCFHRDLSDDDRDTIVELLDSDGDYIDFSRWFLECISDARIVVVKYRNGKLTVSLTDSGRKFASDFNLSN